VTIFWFGILYFALVFLAGFLLGTIRVLFIVPVIGVRSAELLEIPIMLAVLVIAARFIVSKTDASTTPLAHLAIGVLALCVLLLFEFTLVPWLQGMTIHEAIASKDPVSGSAYAISLVLFMLMPWLLALRQQRSRR
jgi:hypothetical protein